MDLRKRNQQALPLLLVCLFSGCAKGGDIDLRRQIAEKVRIGDGTVVTMNELTGYAWSRMHVFSPYTTSADVERELGFSWRGARRVRIHERDDVALLVFEMNERVSGYLAHPRGEGDFAGAGRPGGYGPDDAVFVVRMEDQWPQLIHESQR